jgi:hypothetical protein
VETIKRSANFGDKFECSVHFIIGTLHGIAVLHPWKILGAGSERIATGSAEGMPVSDRKPEVFLHGFLSHFFGRIVIFKGQWIVGIFTFKFDRADAFEILVVS